MAQNFLSLLKKDFQMMVSGKFLLLALGSLILYSCYINLVYVNIDQDIYPVYLYDPAQAIQNSSGTMIRLDSEQALLDMVADGYAVGINVESGQAKIVMLASGLGTTDELRIAYAASLLTQGPEGFAQTVGQLNKDMKNRMEITSEFLYFELAAVGFLGLASTLFKEKHMGVIRVHGVMPVSKSLFILSKLLLFLLADLVFAGLLTLVNVGLPAGLSVLPAVMLQTSILSVIVALVGFLCAVKLPDFKQFSLLYLVLAIFITTPVFLVGQTGIAWRWINFHPMYHMFMALKNAYFGTPSSGKVYYLACGLSIFLLLLLAHKTLKQEMAKEG